MKATLSVEAHRFVAFSQAKYSSNEDDQGRFQKSYTRRFWNTYDLYHEHQKWCEKGYWGLSIKIFFRLLNIDLTGKNWN